MTLGAALMLGVLALAGALAALVQAAAVRDRGGSRASAALYAAGWGALVFIPLAWGIVGGQAAWYAQAVGAYDFAGAIPLALGGGIAALVVAVLMPRSGTVTIDRRRIQGTRPALGLAALSVVWVGWLVLMEFDFNHFVVGIVVSSALLAATSLLATIVVERVRTGRSSLRGAAVGLVTGLSAATAACVFLEPYAAMATGLIAGTSAAAIVYRRNATAIGLAEFIATAGLTGGVIGLLMIGLLEPTRGFFYTGSFGLLMAQLTAVAVCVIYSVLVCVPLSLLAGGHLRRMVNRWAIPDSNR